MLGILQFYLSNVYEFFNRCRSTKSARFLVNAYWSVSPETRILKCYLNYPIGQLSDFLLPLDHPQVPSYYNVSNAKHSIDLDFRSRSRFDFSLLDHEILSYHRPVRFQLEMNLEIYLCEEILAWFTFSFKSFEK